MRNILTILASFVCTSICLCSVETLTINRDIGERKAVWEWKQRWVDWKKDVACQKLGARELEKRELENLEYLDITGNGDLNSHPYKYGKTLIDDDGYDVWNNPNNNRLIIINPDAKVGNAFGAKMNAASVKAGVSRSMTTNEVIVNGGEFGCRSTNGGHYRRLC